MRISRREAVRRPEVRVLAPVRTRTVRAVSVGPTTAG